MTGTKWNKADKVLFGAAIIFILAMLTVKKYPDYIIARGFLFCAEAALIGGIADWFAVTALFRKPLGFPYHTAILPRRRKEFIEAMAKLIRQEFFSQRNLFSLIQKMNLQKELLALLENENVICALEKKTIDLLKEEIKEFDVSKPASVLAGDIKCALKAVPFERIVRWTAEKASGEGGQKFLTELAAYLMLIADTPGMRQNILSFLEEYQEKKMQSMSGIAGLFGGFLKGLAQMSGALDLEDAADIIHKHLLRFLEKASTAGSTEQRELQKSLTDSIVKIAENEECIAAGEAFKNSLIEKLPLEDNICQCLTFMKNNVFPEKGSENSDDTIEKNIIPAFAANSVVANEGMIKAAGQLQKICEETVAGQVENLPDVLQNNQIVKSAMEELFFDIAARSILYARGISDSTVRNVLEIMSDEQLNELVYKKVEPDMLWIRMNGSIVGCFIGAVLFILLNAF